MSIILGFGIERKGPDPEIRDPGIPVFGIRNPGFDNNSSIES